MLDQFFGERVVEGQLFEYLDIGALSGLGLFLDRELQVVEQQPLQLLRRVDVERPREVRIGIGLARHLPDTFLDRLQPGGELFAQLAKMLRVDFNSVGLHRAKNVDQRNLHLAQQPLQRRDFFQLGQQKGIEPPWNQRVLSRVAGDQVGRDLIHRDLFFPDADQVADRDGLVLEIPKRQLVEIVPPLPGEQKVVGDHGIEKDSPNLDADIPQDDLVEFDVLSKLQDRGGLENRLERGEGGFFIQQIAPQRSAQRQVPRAIGLEANGYSDRQREPRTNQFGALDVDGLQVERKDRRLGQELKKLIERLRGIDQPVVDLLGLRRFRAESVGRWEPVKHHRGGFRGRDRREKPLGDRGGFAVWLFDPPGGNRERFFAPRGRVGAGGDLVAFPRRAGEVLRQRKAGRRAAEFLGQL